MTKDTYSTVRAVLHVFLDIAQGENKVMIQRAIVEIDGMLLEVFIENQVTKSK